MNGFYNNDMYDRGMFKSIKETCKSCQSKNIKTCNSTCIYYSLNKWKEFVNEEDDFEKFYEY